MLFLDPSRFTGIETFKKKVDSLIEDCVNCPPMNGFQKVYYPGEIEAEEEMERTKNGIPFSQETRERFFKGLREHHIKLNEDFSF